ncbi:MAG: hypothetical protein IPO21_17925 [Bacteroidales bacterium]|nr:hypothetical protein [Bacteroidales bacterium]
MKKKIFITQAFATLFLFYSCGDNKTNTKEPDIVNDSITTVPVAEDFIKNDTLQPIVEDETDTFIPMAFREYPEDKVEESKKIEEKKEQPISTQKTSSKVVAVPPPPKPETATETVSAERKEKGRTDNTPESVVADTVSSTPVKRKVKGR